METQMKVTLQLRQRLFDYEEAIVTGRQGTIDVYMTQEAFEALIAWHHDDSRFQESIGGYEVSYLNELGRGYLEVVDMQSGDEVRKAFEAGAKATRYDKCHYSDPILIEAWAKGRETSTRQNWQNELI